MAYEGLLERIKKLDVQTIEIMSPDVMARLTHFFDEFLVKNLLYTATTNNEQRKLIKIIKSNYKSWKKDTDMIWGSMPQLVKYPEFMEDLKMDIECGMLITEKGILPVNSARLKVSLIPTVTPLKALQKESQSVLPTDEEKNVASNQSGLTNKSNIESLEVENARLREEQERKNKETAEEQELNKPKPSNSETAHLQFLIKELQNALDEEKAKNVKLEAELADLLDPVEELTASQNVRLELVLQLLRAAGMDDKMLDGQNRKKATVARLMMLLTDIRSNNARKHPEHTCAKYLSDRKYLTKDNKNLIIEINKICIELGLNVTLSLGMS